MGLNFYWKGQLATAEERLELANIALNENIAEFTNYIRKLCNKVEQNIHIGKSSAGWAFLFNHQNWKFFSDKASMIDWLKSGQIVDEYGREYSFEEFWAKVESKKDGEYALESYKKNPQWHILKDGLRFSDSIDFS